MQKIRLFLLLITLLLLLAKASSAQWVSFIDESSTRLTLSTVPLNDDREKDIATADLDQNGFADIIVVRKEPFSTPGAFGDILLLNNGGVLEDQTATFAPEFLTQPTDARDVFILDFDGDGWEDVVIANTFEQPHKYYRNLAVDGQNNWLGLIEESWRIPPMTVFPSQFCAVWGGDVTGDGSPDLYLSNYATSGIAHDVLLVNNGSGVFTDETVSRLGDFRNSAFGTSVEIRDMDNDGDNDIVKVSTLNNVFPWNDQGVFLLFNDGSGFFPVYQKIPSNAAYMFTLGDLNADGQADLYVVDDDQDYVDIATTILPDISVAYDQRFLSNSPKTIFFGGNVKTADVDGDGDLDVGVADIDVDIPGCNRIFALLENEGISSGTLSDPWGSSVESWHQSTFDFAFLDVNGDGRMDIFFGYCDSYVVMTQESLFPPLPLFATAISNTRIDLQWADRSTGEEGTEIERRLHQTFAIPTPVAPIGVVASSPGLGTLLQLIPSVNQFCQEHGFGSTSNLEMSNPRPGLHSWWDNGWQTSEDNSVVFVENLICQTDWAVSAVVGPNVTDYSDAGLATGKKYEYRARAFDGAEVSGVSNSASATTPPVLNPPSDLVATVVMGPSVILSWTDNAIGEHGTKIARREKRTYANPTPVCRIGLETIPEGGLPRNLVKIMNKSATQFCSENGFDAFDSFSMSSPAGGGFSWWNGFAWQSDSASFVLYMVDLVCRTDWVEIGVVNEDETTFTDNDVSSGSDFEYRVRAFHGIEASGYSNVSTASP